MINRRHFVARASLAAAVTAGFPGAGRAAEKLSGKPGQKPRAIIQLVADGMSAGTLTCGDHLSHLMRGRGLTWLQLHQRPQSQVGWMNMRSLNSLVTDSSAASSSWGSGVRIINGMVNMLGDGRPLTTLYELFGQAGWKRGLVTTTEITHATPAGFAASVEDRDHASVIAHQYLIRRIEVLLGGGQKFFDPAYRKDQRDLKKEFAQAGYRTMTSRDELLSAPTDPRWLGIFSRSHLPFTVDQRQSPKLIAQVPTLAEMTSVALKKLERESRFILQVEGGRVDHGCHNCDAAAALFDLIAFDEAIDVCLDFQKRHPETLLVITTDHGNGNLGLNGTGSAYGKSSWMFANLLQVKASFPEMMKQLKRKPIPDLDVEKGSPPDLAEKKRLAALSKEEKTAEDERKKEIPAKPEEIVQIIHAGTGYKPTLSKAKLFAPFLDKKGECLYELMNGDTQQLGQLLGNHLGIGWTGNAHTADYVPILALGPAAEHFRGFINNTQVFDHYLAMADIDFRNPSEPLIACAGPEASESEDTEPYRYA